MIFFGLYNVCRIFLNITLELFCVFRNTEYNGSKYAHFSLNFFINYCEFIIVIVLKSFSNHLYSGPYVAGEPRASAKGASFLGGSGGMLPRENFQN